MSRFQLELTALCLLILIAGVACGKLGTIEHEGTITAKVTVDETMLNGYFARYCCKEQFLASGVTLDDELIASCAETPTDSITQCSKNWTADFLAALTAAIPAATPVTGGV